MRKIFLFFLLSIAVLTAGCSGAEKSAQGSEMRTVRIAYLPITHALPLFAEKELLSTDDNVQIELIKYGSWPELMDALNEWQNYSVGAGNVYYNWTGAAGHPVFADTMD